MHKSVSYGALCALLLAHCVLPAESTICWIDPSDDFHERMPLILRANSDEFVYPSKCGSKSLRLTFQDDLRAACPTDSISVLGSNTNLDVARLSCYGITLFGLGGTSYAAPFSQIRCNKVPQAATQATTASCVNGTISRIGFAVSSTSFVPIIEEVCANGPQTLWTHHKVVQGLTKGASKLDGLGGGFLNGWGGWLRPTTTTQSSTSVGSVASEIIDTMFVPREDMFYKAQQDATSSSLNSLPMYRSVKNGNWRLVEDIVRKIASTRRHCATLDVWTGIYNGMAGGAPTTTTTTTTAAPTTARVPSTTTTSTTAASTATGAPSTTTTTSTTAASTTTGAPSSSTTSTTAASTTTGAPSSSTTSTTDASTTTGAPSSSTTSTTDASTTTGAPSSTTTSTTIAPTTTDSMVPTVDPGRLSRQMQSGATPETNSPARFAYKMVVDKARNRGIVFVTLNDPSVTVVTAAEQLCATTYNQCGTLYPQFNVATRGYTHCCTLDAFADVAADIGLPTFANVQPLI